MQVTVELKNMFSYSIIPIIILLVFIIIFIIFYKRKNNNKNIIIIEPSKQNKDIIKKKYLLEIDNLINEINFNKVSNRQGYQKLSILIRNFVYESTNIKVNVYTLSDIEKINMPILCELIKEYYDPEFSKNSIGNILSSIEKTKKVIEKWK